MNGTVGRYQDLSHDQLVHLLEKHDRQQKLGLVWERNEIEVDRTLEAEFVALDLLPDKSDPATSAAGWPNLVVEGDNYDVLRRLRMTLAEIFVAVLGASNYTFAEATWSQALPDWISSHVRLFRHIGGFPRLLVPDNLKSGVNKASFYDPEVNRSYGRMAAHYDVGVLPTRPRKPRDKASVEAGVRFAQSYIIGRLRNQTFFSLDEANAATAEVMTRMNTRPMRKLGVSRADLLESLDRPVLRALPLIDYEYAEWRLVRAGLDYHVEIESFYYSVPHGLIREQVDARITTRTIELFHRGKRVASHQRRYGSAARHGTDAEHMPQAHRHYADWSPERFCRWERFIKAMAASCQPPARTRNS